MPRRFNVNKCVEVGIMENRKSYLMLIGSMLIYGTVGIFRRYIPVDSGFLACSRGFIGALCLFLFMKISGRSIKKEIGNKNLIWLIITGGLIGINWIMLFEAFNYTTVATATLCYYMEPTIVILISPIFFKEKLTVKKIICAIVAIVGMIFVSGILEQGTSTSGNFIGVLLGLGAAMIYATVIVLNKKIHVDDPYLKTLIQLLSAAIILVPYVLMTSDISNTEMNALAIVMIIIVGIVHTGLAYALYFGSMEGLKSQTIAILSYIDPVSAIILAALILHEKMSVFGIVGAVLILGAAIISELKTGSEEA